MVHGSIDAVGNRHRSVKPDLVYNIPAKLLDDTRWRHVIVRSLSAQELVQAVSAADKGRVRFLQLLTIDQEVSVLEGTLDDVPIEIVLADPNQFQLLYSLVTLLDTHPVRIAIPVVAGFNKATKLALSLNFAVKLRVEQPDEQCLEELKSILDLYLHRGFVHQPVEFFHTLLGSYYNDEVVSLWEIAEDDPARVRYIGEDGEDLTLHTTASLAQLRENRECNACEFFDRCQGYFKWPHSSYSCSGIKEILGNLRTAADEVKQDLANYKTMGAGV